MTTTAQALEALAVCGQTLRHFTRTPSTLADTAARSQMHKAIATLRQHIESTAAEIARLQAECEALRKDAARLDAGCIIMNSRDDLGDTIKCEHRWMNLRAAIDEAIAYAAISTSTAPSGAEE